MDNVRQTVIMGSGCSGLTAAIYAARANLKPLVLEGHEPGGQLSLTTLVENFPGFPEGIQGPELIENMRKQAARFGAEYRTSHVVSADLSKRPFTLSLEAGRITRITPRASLADGLVGNLEPGSMTFPLVKQVVDYVVTVSEDDLTRAMKGLATEERLIVEGAGAAATAAVMAGKASAPGQRVVVMVTGGNVDLPKWLFAIS